MSLQATPNVYQFDVRGVSKRLRHAAIFGALESLDRGDVMRFVNDHDPLPLLSQIAQRYEGQVHHEYVQNNAEAVIIDFTIHPKEQLEAAAAAGAAGAAVAAEAPQTGGCGGGGGGCGCQGT